MVFHRLDWFDLHLAGYRDLPIANRAPASRLVVRSRRSYIRSLSVSRSIPRRPDGIDSMLLGTLM